MQHLCELLGVYKHYSLGHFTGAEHLFQEFWLLALLAAEFELLDVVELQGLFLNADLLRLSDDLANCLLDFFWIGCTEQYVLDLVLQLCHIVFDDFCQSLLVLLVCEKYISFINHEALKL